MTHRPYLLFVSNTTGFRVGNILHGILRECRQYKFGLLWREFDRCNLDSLRTKPTGAVVWGSLDHIDRFMAKVRGRFPVVSTISHTLERKMDTVVPDPVNIAEQVADHLVAEGLRTFIFVGSRLNPAAQRRYTAFREILTRRSLGAAVRFFNVELSERFWGADSPRGQAFVALLRRTRAPLGVFAFNDQTAASCLECAEFAGLRVPQQMCIVGVDDHPIFSHMYLPLSTVKIDYTAIGRKAARLLIGAADQPSNRNLGQHFVAGSLIVRESSRLRLLGDGRIAKVLHILHESYSQPTSLIELARKAGMSRAGFAQTFRDTIGLAPMRYLVGLRLQQAKVLLAESPLTIAEISQRVGYEDQGHFARVFKQAERLTPSEYRRLRMVRPLLTA